jgi:hypothetical protein
MATTLSWPTLLAVACDARIGTTVTGRGGGRDWAMAVVGGGARTGGESSGSQLIPSHMDS